MADYSEELLVPNPESVEKDVSIVMHYIPDFEKYDRIYKK